MLKPHSKRVGKMSTVFINIHNILGETFKPITLGIKRTFILKNTLETSGEGVKLHSKRVEKMLKIHSKRVLTLTENDNDMSV